MLRKRGGTLINQGSIASEMPAPILGAYTASKHAVEGFTNSLRQELIEEGAPVNVTLIQPASIHTPFDKHAKNYMEGAATVPPPLYAPEVVADAVLAAAEKSIRNVIVGGAGRALTTVQKWLPKVSDQLFSRAFVALGEDSSRPPRKDEGGFDTPGSAGEMYGDQADFMLKSSLYASAKTRPLKTFATLAAVGAGSGGADAAGCCGHQAQGDQKRTETTNGPPPTPYG